MKKDLVQRMVVVLLVSAGVFAGIWAIHIHHGKNLKNTRHTHKIILHD
ncbi:MAG: hypothetical protein V4590_06725 [Bacteroidota bacterium]